MELSGQDIVLFYGGTQLNDAQFDTIKEIARQVLELNAGVVILSGGFKGWEPPRTGRPTDVAVLEAAVEFCDSHDIQLDERFATLIPYTKLERQNVVRFVEGTKISSHYQSPMMRRFQLVQLADIIITMEGEILTEIVLSAGLVLPYKVVLPIGSIGTENDSRTFWSQQRKSILNRFPEIQELADNIDVFDPSASSPEERKEFARLVAAEVGKALKRIRQEPFPALKAFMESAFDNADFNNFLYNTFSWEIAEATPFNENASLRENILEGIGYLNRQGLINAKFFDALSAAKPFRKDEIALLRQIWQM
jgi:hypothetical protein